MDRIIVAFSDPDCHRYINDLLASQGFSPHACFLCGIDVIRAVHKLGTAVVISGWRLRDTTAVHLAATLRGRAEIIVITSPGNQGICTAENLHLAPAPVSPALFFDLLERLHHKEAQQLRPSFLQRRESEREIINRAKALLICRHHLMEEEAHRFLQRKSMFTGLRMVEVAQIFLDQFSA